MRKTLKPVVALLALFSCTVARAAIQIGSVSTPWQKLVTIFQGVIDVIDGPVGLGIVALAWLGVWLVWAVAPREGIIGGAFRVGTAAVAVFSTGAFMTHLGAP